MKLTFLGSGSAFTVGEDNFHSNMLLEDNSNRLLIDCGSDARLSLQAQGFCHRDINDVYISHLHADHAGGLEWLAFTTKFDRIQPSRKPVLHISDLLVDRLWNNVLSGGLQSIKGTVAELSTYFTVDPIGKENSFLWSTIEVHLVQTEHIFSGKDLVPSYGLFFTASGLTCFITTDTQFKPDKHMPYYQKADIIFHDCETTKKPSGVHPHYSQLITLDADIKAKMWLYHYNPGVLPDAKKDGFRGFIKKGQSFDLSKK